MPRGNCEPEGGEQTTVERRQLLFTQGMESFLTPVGYVAALRRTMKPTYGRVSKVNQERECGSMLISAS